VPNRYWGSLVTDSPDYNLRFHTAVAQAFASSDAAVRRAYLDLADFYREKIVDGVNMFPSADILRASILEA
jgi:hypothetical protein